jgi:type I restriction enzyme S subunit
LFGRRRAYQRKVAVADFDAVCSGDIYVFESADPTKLLPGLLPFICQTDEFFGHAVGTSAGSLSPRTNWSSLASYELTLPPLDEQQRALDLLACMRSVSELHQDAVRCADQLFASSLEHFMASGTGKKTPVRTRSITHPPSWKVHELSQRALVERGVFAHRPRNLPEFFGGRYPFVQTGDIAASRGTLAGASQRLSELGRSYSRSFPPGTILITVAAVIGATAITTEETWCPDSVAGILPLSERVNVRFLEYALRRLRPVLEHQEATRTAQKNINLMTLRPLLVALPERPEQDEIVATLLSLEERESSLRARASRARELATLNRRQPDPEDVTSRPTRRRRRGSAATARCRSDPRRSRTS